MAEHRGPQILRSARRYLRLRIELLELELNDERARLGALLTRSLLFALTAMLALQLLAVLLIAISWETSWRWHVMTALTALAMLVSALSWRALIDLRKPKPPQPLSSLLDDFDALLVPAPSQEEKLQ